MRDTMLRLLILILCGLVAATIAIALIKGDTPIENSKESIVTHACTTEAKICPDGSSVGRTGPHCEFAECPVAPIASTTTPIASSTDVGTLPNGAQPEFGYTNEPGGGGGSAGPVTACTMDAKQCPDGSYVGRSGPKCEFICPEVKGASDDKSIIGTVLVGPTCPVINENNLEACADKPYVGVITLTNTTLGSSFDIKTDSEGMFRTPLPLGKYTISRDQSASAFPTCSGELTIARDTHAVHIMCDTGIR